MKTNRTISWRIEALSGFVVVAFITIAWASLQLFNAPSIERTSTTQTSTLPNTALADPEPIQSRSISDELQSTIDDFIAVADAHYSIVVESLDNSFYAAHKADTPVRAASLYKLFAAQEALRLIDDGALKAETIVDGERDFSLDRCIELSITISDNACGAILQSMIGAANDNPLSLAKQGFLGTDLTGIYPQTTAGDTARFLKQLKTETYLSAAGRDLLHNHLENQTINDGLSLGLPSSVLFAHKTGELQGVVNDAGIVYGQKTAYVIAVLSGPHKQPEAVKQELASLSASLYEIINR